MIGNYFTQTSTVWMGVIEDTNDPLKLGRCRVRIFGVHSDNLKEVPTKDLPWASPMMPPNADNFSVPVEGTYVFGYFPDGGAAQAPVMMGSVPGFMSKDWNKNKGFSPQSDNPIKTDNPHNAGYKVNIPTTGFAARGDVANTNVKTTNGILDHACDFRFFINLPILNIAQINDPIAAIKDAIKSGKNKSAQLMGLVLQQMNTYLRGLINGLLPALGLDPTGIVSKSYSVGKDIIRKINNLTKKIAAIAETASLYYYLVVDIQKIVDYLRSLPDRLKAMIQGCIAQFLGSIQQFINMLKSIPGMYSSSVEGILSQLSGSTQAALDAANTQQQAANTGSVSELISITLYNTDADHANLITNYISTNFANAEVTLANATANSFDNTSIQSP